MKRCRIPGAVLMVLVLASLFIVSGCGIPTYLYIPESSIKWNSEQSKEKDSLEMHVSLYDDALSTINEKVKEGPSIKFFYVLSTNSSETAELFSGSDYALSEVSSAFNTHYKGTTGNGYPWSPQSNSMAHGFYLYAPAEGFTHTFSAYRPDELKMTDDDDGGILVGTFSYGESINESDYSFGISPYMDLKISTINNTNTFSISKELDETATGEPSVVSLNLSSNETVYLKSYKKNPFPLAKEQTETITTLLEEDGYFYEGLKSDITDQLYLHIWASLYGGEGDFTNIYWSELQYLGYIELF